MQALCDDGTLQWQRLCLAQLAAERHNRDLMTSHVSVCLCCLVLCCESDTALLHDLVPIAGSHGIDMGIKR